MKDRQVLELERAHSPQVHGLALVGLLQRLELGAPAADGTAFPPAPVLPAVALDTQQAVLLRAAHWALQYVRQDPAVVELRPPAEEAAPSVACCRYSCHCCFLHEGISLQVTGGYTRVTAFRCQGVARGYQPTCDRGWHGGYSLQVTGVGTRVKAFRCQGVARGYQPTGDRGWHGGYSLQVTGGGTRVTAFR